MSIEQSLERIATALEKLSSGDTIGSGTPVEIATSAAVKRGPGRPPKAAASAPTAPVAQAATPVAQPATDPVITKQQLGAKFVDLIKAGRRDDVAAILQQHGAKDLSSLSEQQYGAVYEAAQAALSA